MNRTTLAGIGKPQPSQDRQLDMARVNRDPRPTLILAQVIEAARLVHVLGLDTLQGCMVMPRKVLATPATASSPNSNQAQ